MFREDIYEKNYYKFFQLNDYRCFLQFLGRHLKKNLCLESKFISCLNRSNDSEPEFAKWPIFESGYPRPIVGMLYQTCICTKPRWWVLEITFNLHVSIRNFKIFEQLFYISVMRCRFSIQRILFISRQNCQFLAST